MDNQIAKQQVRMALGGIVGACTGVVFYWLTQRPLIWQAAVLGGIIGVLIGIVWPLFRSFALRHRIEDWRLEEVELQGFKFTIAGAQRRVAWRLFVEITTRIATQPMQDETGDDGIALKSLYELFQLTRKAISEMEPTPSATGDTVETFALDMLNSDLRPFLSTWHPKWDEYAEGGKAVSQAWPKHREFRVELREIQTKIKSRARGLAQLAGVRNVDRFFRN